MTCGVFGVIQEDFSDDETSGKWLVEFLAWYRTSLMMKLQAWASVHSLCHAKPSLNRCWNSSSCFGVKDSTREQFSFGPPPLPLPLPLPAECLLLLVLSSTLTLSPPSKPFPLLAPPSKDWGVNYLLHWMKSRCHQLVTVLLYITPRHSDMNCSRQTPLLLNPPMILAGLTARLVRIMWGGRQSNHALGQISLHQAGSECCGHPTVEAEGDQVQYCK